LTVRIGQSRVPPTGAIFLAGSPRSHIIEENDFRNARCRVLALRLADRIPGGHELLAREGAKAMVPLFTDYKSLNRTPGNRVLVGPREANQLRKQIEQAIDAMANGKARAEDERLLDMHLIPRFEGPQQIYHDPIKQVIAQRPSEIENMEATFFGYALMP
jgi:hypothetical protein